MSQPHHFVFNEIERVIRNSVPDNQKLLDSLIAKKVLSEADRDKFTGKHGMKCLTSYLRIKNFETFVTFLECIRDVSQLDPSIDVTILETVRGAVRTFDENHRTKFEEKVPQLKKTLGEEFAVVDTSCSSSHPEAVGPLTQATNEQVYTEMDFIPLIGDPVEIRVGPEGGSLSSPLTDFEITIPPGAVTKHCVIRGARCAYGMFHVPNDVYRISDFICITMDGQLKSAVDVQIAHCLSMPEYENTPAIEILHTDMLHRNESDEFVFSSLDCTTKISSTKPFISFQVQEFCIFCAVYSPRHYRGLQKQGKDNKSKFSCRSSPYERPTIPRLDYVLLFFEKEKRESPFRVQIFCCLNCPGSIELCIQRMKQEGSWREPVSRNFDFTSSNVIFMEVVEVKSEGWEVASKVQCINECDIQRSNITALKGKRQDTIRCSDNTTYPPSMIMEVINVEPNGSYLKLQIMIKDGKDGECVIPDTYEVVLPKPTYNHKSSTGNQNVHGQVKNPVLGKMKRSVSAEEEKCLEETDVTVLSMARVSRHIMYWKQVAKELSLSDVEIDQIEDECHHRNEPVCEIVYQILYAWHRSSAERTTFKVLVDALKNSEDYDAVNYILENITTLNSSSNS